MFQEECFKVCYEDKLLFEVDISNQHIFEVGFVFEVEGSEIVSEALVVDRIFSLCKIDEGRLQSIEKICLCKLFSDQSRMLTGRAGLAGSMGLS